MDKTSKILFVVRMKNIWKEPETTIPPQIEFFYWLCNYYHPGFCPNSGFNVNSFVGRGDK